MAKLLHHPEIIEVGPHLGDHLVRCDPEMREGASVGRDQQQIPLGALRKGLEPGMVLAEVGVDDLSGNRFALSAEAVDDTRNGRVRP